MNKIFQNVIFIFLESVYNNRGLFFGIRGYTAEKNRIKSWIIGKNSLFVWKLRDISVTYTAAWPTLLKM